MKPPAIWFLAYYDDTDGSFVAYPGNNSHRNTTGITETFRTIHGARSYRKSHPETQEYMPCLKGETFAARYKRWKSFDSPVLPPYMRFRNI